MKVNILWTGVEYYSLENCVLTTTNSGSEANSVIIGLYDDKIYRFEYQIKADKNWNTTFVQIKSQFDDIKTSITFQSDLKGNWIVDGKHAELFNGCTDIDISLTPFTNTLPINRLKLAKTQKCQIKVIYFNLLKQEIIAVSQSYSVISKDEYKYENVPNDFEAVLKVDDLGLVIDYPGLFIRTEKKVSDYH